MDGTFLYCVKFFKQLFTIHATENVHYIPLVFFLLSNKSTKAYISLFEILIEQCKIFNFDLNPEIIVADVEVAIQNAVKCVFPKSSIRLCRFHVTQAWWRKIQELGLTKDYKDSKSDIGKWQHWVFGLPYLLANEVSDSFDEVSETKK